MPTISELRTALRYPSEAAPPDTDAIIRRGRRQRHLHQALAGAATAVVLVAAGVATLGLRPGGSSEPSPAPSNAPSLAGPDPVTGTRPNPLLVAASSRLDAQAPDRFDPRVRTLHVGWIPDGLTRELSMITATSQEYGALGPDGTGILVIVLAHAVPASQLPSGQIGMPDNASSIVVGPEFAVRGRPAHCLSDPRVPGSCFAIQWQYADGAWARATGGRWSSSPSPISGCSANSGPRRATPAHTPPTSTSSRPPTPSPPGSDGPPKDRDGTRQERRSSRVGEAPTRQERRSCGVGGGPGSSPDRRRRRRRGSPR